jgi:hypothetical protein
MSDEECVDQEIRQMLKEKLDYEIRKHERLAEDMGLKRSMEILPKLRALAKVVDDAPMCTEIDVLEYRKNIVSEPRKKTPRQDFMSLCMRSPTKGGQGKDMSTCSIEWREKGGK